MLTIRGRLGGFCGWAPDVDGDTNWDAELEGFGEDDGIVGEALLAPELTGCLRDNAQQQERPVIMR